MIFFTGDTHGVLDTSKIYRLQAVVPKVSTDKENYLIILGDFGCIWNDPHGYQRINDLDMFNIETLYADVPWITLFVDGNHENHKVLNKLAVQTRWGGKVHQITPYCYHLMRGEVYVVQGVSIFAMGGALSVDKVCRRENVSWWPEELITQADYDNAMSNLDKHSYNVDYVVTHTCPSGVLNELQGVLPAYNEKLWGKKLDDVSCVYLEQIRKQLQFKEWFFGHFHVNHDMNYEGKVFHCLYNSIKATTEEETKNE